jgi:DNA invertase Pin-like site-specific DNA recombinase
MKASKYVAYYRVSTQKQGKSGLGLEAQRSAVRGFVKDCPIIAEFTEVESGKKNQRVQLQAAIDQAKREGAFLIIAKLDRLSRNASFIFTLRDSGVDFQCVDLPEANTLTIGIFATLAQHERELISARTKAGLAVKKEQGIKLGKPENLTEEARQKGVDGNRRRAALNPNNTRAMETIGMYKAAGMKYTEIAERLNKNGFRTSRGGMFQATQVQRLFKRLTAGS